MPATQEMPLKGPALHRALLEKFRAVPTVEGGLNCEKLADAALQISAVYDLVFGGGFISRHLKQDIANSSGRMRAAADALQKSRGGGVVCADELINWEIKELGISRMRKDQHSGVRGCECQGMRTGGVRPHLEALPHRLGFELDEVEACVQSIEEDIRP